VDEISLTLPADDGFRRVARLVLGGFAVRLELTYESLEDIELALDALLQRCRDDAEVTIRVRVEDDELRTVVGPFPPEALRELEQEAGDALDLRRILTAVCDRFEVTDGWVELTKRIDAQK
jgi:phosphoglycolate phosphatase-like HAD superfamily hydrolase